jgi:hypothetical protein
MVIADHIWFFFNCREHWNLALQGGMLMLAFHRFDGYFSFWSGMELRGAGDNKIMGVQSCLGRPA